MTINYIEKVVAQLNIREFDRYRTWFEEFQASRVDQKIERDAQGCKLDHLVDAVVSDLRKGRTASYEEFRQPGI